MMPTPHIASKKLGQLLVERGWITGEQLIRAIQSQRVVGGRIGTCLLEMDVLTEDKLLDALSGQLSVPPARIEELRAIGDGILEMIPTKVASRWQAVPFAVDATDIQVATLNVKNLACLDEIEFCTNKRVLPHIANEVRIFEALEKYYGVECPRRYNHLLDRLNRSRYMWDESAKILLGASETEWREPPAEPTHSGRTDDDSQLITSASSRSTQTLSAQTPSTPTRSTPTRSTPTPSSPTLSTPTRSTQSLSNQTLSTQTLSTQTPRPTPVDEVEPSTGERLNTITWPTSIDRLTNGRSSADRSAAATQGGTASIPTPAILGLDDVEQLLAGQTDQKSIGRIILRFLGQSFSRCAIFAVKNDQVRGWLYRGEGFEDERFRDLSLKLDQPSAFLGMVKGAELYLGPLAPMPAHRQLAKCWGGDLPEQCLMIPVRLRGRLVSILYGDRGARGIQGIEVEPIKQLAEKAAIAFELCILRRKLHQKIVSS